MTPLPRRDWSSLNRYDPEREPVSVDLSDNTNLWGTHPDALARIRAADQNDLARYPELYSDVLRDAVSERFDVDAACVTTGAGSDDILDSTFRATYAPGATMTYAAPTFSMVAPFAVMNGLAARPVPWPEADERPEALLEGDPALIYVCRPNNPTGTLAPREWLEQLVELRGDAGPLILVDEAYADFAGETMISLAPSIPEFLVARTASKAYGLAGLRCGFAVASPDVVLEVDKSRGPYKVSHLAAAAAAAAVRDEQGWMAGVIAKCLVNRERLYTELEARGLQPVPSSANFILFRAPSGDGRADARALRAAGIGVRPFGDIPGTGDGLRVTVGPWATMDRFLAALDDVLGALAASAGDTR